MDLEIAALRVFFPDLPDRLNTFPADTGNFAFSITSSVAAPNVSTIASAFLRPSPLTTPEERYLIIPSDVTGRV